MKWGLNLSFAVKRWLEPEVLAAMIRRDFGVEHIQFSWDIIDPWYPAEQRGILSELWRKAFEAEGVKIDCTFGGNASYAMPHLLSPLKEQREAGLIFFKRACDLTLELGADVMGTPLGGLSCRDARDKERRELLYQEALEGMRELASYGREKGLKEIHIEPTPVFGEIPYNIEESRRLMEDLKGADIPVKLLLDWGHALYEPLLKEEADIERWFKELAPFVGSIHLQQTDGKWDRHWDFTHTGGIVTPELMKRATSEAGLDEIYQYLEVVTIYEDDDDHVYEGMKKTCDYLHRTID
ncbi:MAG: sugar phosphate isomerase/epimerase [Lachnospiraceae bacterium]|nr:sugar phosphate isomerase/epimerase [Lachnospiraceae bacterium]